MTHNRKILSNIYMLPKALKVQLFAQKYLIRIRIRKSVYYKCYVEKFQKLFIDHTNKKVCSYFLAGRFLMEKQMCLQQAAEFAPLPL